MNNPQISMSFESLYKWCANSRMLVTFYRPGNLCSICIKLVVADRVWNHQGLPSCPLPSLPQYVEQSGKKTHGTVVECFTIDICIFLSWSGTILPKTSKLFWPMTNKKKKPSPVNLNEREASKQSVDSLVIICFLHNNTELQGKKRMIMTESTGYLDMNKKPVSSN